MPIFISLFLLFCIWLRYERKKSTRIHTEVMNTFIKEEKAANLARKQDISQLDYLVIPFDRLPMEETKEETNQSFIQQVASYRDKRMVNLSALNNNELKLRYGIAHFEQLSEYEENYYTFTKLLDEWALYLYDTSQYSKAKMVLRYAISIQSEIANTYLTLAKTHVALMEQLELQELISFVKNESPIKNLSVIQTLETLSSNPHNLAGAPL